MILDQKTTARIDSLYQNAKMMRWLCIIGVAIPLVLLIASALGIVYWFWRRDLLSKLAGSFTPTLTSPSLPDQSGQTAIEDKIAYIREAKYAFLAPSIVLATYVVLLTGVIILPIFHTPG